MSPTKVVKSGTCGIPSISLSQMCFDEGLPQKEVVCPAPCLHWWHRYGRYPRGRVDGRTD